MKMYDFYKKYYKLCNLGISYSKHKIVLLIYDDKYNYYLQEGKMVSVCDDGNMLDIINKINNIYKLKIINYYPLCFCDTTLIISCKTMSCDSVGLSFVNYSDVLDKKLKKVINYHREKDIILYVSSNVKREISMSQKYLYRYKIHEKYIKKYLLTDKKRKKSEFKVLLNELIPKKKSIIDISCGDSSDVFCIAKEKNFDVIVGNDICLNYLYTNMDKQIIYTNDNIEQNFVGDSVYDVSYCKNTLHHMNDIVCINNLLSFLKRISNEIIIIEIINPKETGGIPKFLNKYLYTMFLKDAGNCFLSKEQFISVIDNKFNGYDINYSVFKNILGEYMVAKITKK